MGRHGDFMMEALVDFPDDALGAPEPITVAHIDAMMRRLAECGVRRVSWGYYADGLGGFLTPTHDPQWSNLARTYQALGQNPLAVAVAAAHRYGLELFAYFKPYETGPACLFPMGSLEAAAYGRLDQVGGRMTWIHPFVANHPHLRIKRRADDPVPDASQAAIASMKLRKSDSAPTRITGEHLKIWVSDLNHRYRVLDVPFTFVDSVEAGRDGPQRVLTLGGLDLRTPYVLVTTDFTEGPADFANNALEMVTACDADGRELPCEVATGWAVWFADRVDFRSWGVMFDTGWSGVAPVCLDEPNAGGRDGFVAIARGRNAYLPGALCETEPEVQAFWLSCIQSMLDAGVDGIDFREENHSTHTDHPLDYGFNDAVIARCRERGGVDLATIAAVRGDAYTSFLQRAKRLINGRGRTMRIHFQIDWYRSDPDVGRLPAYPANIDFQWRRWIDLGLTDSAVLRFFALPFDCVFNDAVAHELVDRCRAGGIPITVNRYIHRETLVDEVRRVKEDGRFAGFILYETNSFMGFDTAGGCTITAPEVVELCR